jgi:hypothetical protein
MDQLLPRGFVVNSPTVNQGIQSIASEPLDPADIAKFWKGTAVMSCLRGRETF